MKKLIAPLLVLVATSAFAAEPTCHVPKEQWMKQDDFKAQMVAQGYTVKTLKVTKGCYEIYGHDKAGKRVEMSFDPATGMPAK